jgi:hypothetical protein
MRNAVIAELEAHIGRPVTLSEQISDIPEFPYCYYSVLAPRISDHWFGLREVVSEGEEFKLVRSEPVSATLSFTFCSMNRETDDGYVFGEDEALSLCEKAHGFFLLNGHNLRTVHGDIVVNTVGSVTNRTGFFVEDSIRRYGFDVRFSYVRTDEKPTTTVLHPGNPAGNAHS